MVLQTLGNAVPCMTTFLLDHIESDPSSGLTEKNVRDAAATAYIGGADTVGAFEYQSVNSILTSFQTASICSAFFLAMT